MSPQCGEWVSRGPGKVGLGATCCLTPQQCRQGAAPSLTAESVPCRLVATCPREVTCPWPDLPEGTARASCKWCWKEGQPLASLKDSNFPTGPGKRLLLGVGSRALPLSVLPFLRAPPALSGLAPKASLESLVVAPLHLGVFAHAVPSSRHTLPSPLSWLMSVHAPLLQEAPFDYPRRSLGPLSPSTSRYLCNDVIHICLL